MHLVTFSNPRLAQAFVDYMATQRIMLKVQPISEHEIALYYDIEADLPHIQSELAQFLAHPDDPRYCAASWETGHTLPMDKVAMAWRLPSWSSLKQQVGMLTLSVTALTILMFIGESIFGVRESLAWFGFPYESAEYVQIWRWITPILIHFSLLHIIMNLFWWWYLGSMVEKHLSTWKLLEITLLSGIISNYCESVISGPNFGGLSGVVYALMGYVWLMGIKRPKLGMSLPSAMLVLAVIWLFAGFTGYLGPIANGAHLAGLLVGLLIALKDSSVVTPKSTKK